MKGWILGIALIAGAGAGGAYYWKQSLEVSDRQLASYVPADTALYFGVRADSGLLSQMEGFYSHPGLGKDLQLLVDELQKGGGNPELRAFASSVLKDLIDTDGNAVSFFNQLGLDAAGAQQIYLDGMVPVVHLTSKTAGQFRSYWETRAKQSGLRIFSEDISQQNLLRIRLTPASQPLSVDLLIAESGNTAVLSFVTPLDTPEELAQRVLVKQPEKSLVASGRLDQLKQKYQFTDHMALFVDIQHIARAVLNTESSRLSDDISQLFQLIGEVTVDQQLSQQCRNEYSDLASWVPQLVAGYTKVETDPELRLQSRSVLEIKSGDTLNLLKALNGHLPSHVSELDKQIIGLGVALDMDQLMPVLVQLWTSFNQIQFQCAELQRLQRQMAQNNPALLGVFTGMAQGIKGVAASLYDLEFGSLNSPVKSIDLLLTIATANPQLVANLVSTSPIGKLSLPLDGSTGQVDLSELIPGLEGRTAIRGSHITLSTGPVSDTEATKLATESLDKNGLFEMSVNYPAMTGVIEKLPVNELQPLLSGARDTSLCLEHARTVDLLQRYPFSASYRTAFSDLGLQTDLRIGLDRVADEAAYNPVGKYRVEDQTWDCPRGVESGYEEINQDGTGRFYQVSPDQKCELFEYRYNWTQNANRLIFDINSSRSRDNCKAEWDGYESYTAECTLTAIEGGFSCIYDDGESEGLFAYRRIN